MVKARSASALRGRSLSVALFPLVAALSGCQGVLGGDPPSDSSEVGKEGEGGGAGEGAGGEGGGGSAQGGGGAGGGQKAPWQQVETDWCSKEWLGLDEHTCFYAPASLADPPTVLFFLHGMMPPDASPASLESIAKQAADKSGFVAIFPRGEQGLCAWDASVLDWWCWPTKRETVDVYAAALLDEWQASQAIVEEVLATTFKRRYVMGFSNGGYFSSYIGLEGLLAVDGAGVVAAGRSYIDEPLMATSLPFYIAVGDLDTALVKDSAVNLASVLDKYAWPNTLVVHPDRGHEIRADDFDGALSAWGWP